MNELINYQSEAVNLANLTLSSMTQSVVLAAKTGDALMKVKESLPHGEYIPWVEANMPINRKQCSKFMRLAKEKPDLLSNGYLNTHLDVDSEIRLLSMDGDEAESIRDSAKENNLTQKQIAELTKQLEAKTNEAEEWRQEKFSHRDEARRIAIELKRVKESKKEIIYVDDSEKALCQYKEEAEGKIRKLEKIKNVAVDDLKKVRQEINEKVAKKLGVHKEKIEEMQKQEVQLLGSIEKLDEKWNELDNSIGNRVDNAKAIKLCMNDLEMLSIHAGVLQEDEGTDEEKAEWKAFFNKVISGAEYYLKLLD